MGYLLLWPLLVNIHVFVDHYSVEYSRISLVLFKLLPQHWNSELVSPSASKSVHGPFKRSAWDSSLPLSHSATISTVFSARNVGTPLPQTGNLGWGARCGVRTPPQVQYLFRFLTTTFRSGTCLVMSLPILPVLRWLLLYVLS